MADPSVADLVRSFELHLRAESEIPGSPMAKMRPPTVPDQPVPLVREDAFRQLLEASAGRDFEPAATRP